MFKIPKTEVKITKELLLSKNSEETYLSNYLGMGISKGLHVSPLRSDKKPTASFFRNKQGDLIFHDFGSNFHGNFISVVMELQKCSYYKALKIIANDFDIVNFDDYSKTINEIKQSEIIYTETQSTSIIQVEIKEFTIKELEWWNSFGISKKTLDKYKVFSLASIFLNGNYFASSSDKSPMYGYFGGKKDDIELWRIYMPTKRTYRFLSNWSSSLCQGMKQIKKKANHCIISKAMKDVMLLHEFGFNAIAPTSETILISESKYFRLNEAYKDNMLIFFDNDKAGVNASNKYKKKYGCRCIFIKRKFAKDISDLKKSLSDTQFWLAIDELNQIINDKSIRKTKHFYVF